MQNFHQTFDGDNSDNGDGCRVSIVKNRAQQIKKNNFKHLFFLSYTRSLQNIPK